MRERRTAATDGARLLTDDGIEPLTANAVIRLTMLDHHTRVWCAHGWQDIKPIAAQLLKRLPLQSNPAKEGVWGTFNIRGHFYSFRVRMGGITVDFLDVRNITRDDGLDVSRETFGGADDLETTWNIAQECAALNLKGTTIASWRWAITSGEITQDSNSTFLHWIRMIITGCAARTMGR